MILLYGLCFMDNTCCFMDSTFVSVVGLLLEPSTIKKSD